MAKCPSLEIRCDENGFVVIDSEPGRPNASVTWSTINTVLAFKRDLFAVDLICLAFGTADGAIEVHEEMQGWQQLVEQLPFKLPGASPLAEWWQRVAQPPFGASVTTIYKAKTETLEPQGL